MKKGLFIQILLAALLLPVFSCSDDDGLPELNNVTTLNMLDTNNGATYLGNSDIHITDAYNFLTYESLIAEIGESKGLGKALPPKVSNALVRQVAVKPGYLYQAFPSEAIRRFHSGQFALALSSGYYQFYVEKELMEEDIRIGAVVRFALIDTPENELPAYDSTIGMLRITKPDEVFKYHFSKDTEVEWEGDWNESLNINYENGELSVSSTHYFWFTGEKQLTIYARRGTSYTRIYLNLIGKEA